MAILKDAWFVGSPTFYCGIVVGAGVLPFSVKGWALIGVTIAYGVLFLILFANDYLSLVAYIVLALPGLFMSSRIATAKTLWTTPEKVKELAGWGR